MHTDKKTGAGKMSREGGEGTGVRIRRKFCSAYPHIRRHGHLLKSNSIQQTKILNAKPLKITQIVNECFLSE